MQSTFCVCMSEKLFPNVGINHLQPFSHKELLCWPHTSEKLLANIYCAEKVKDQIRTLWLFCQLWQWVPLNGFYQENIVSIPELPLLQFWVQNEAVTDLNRSVWCWSGKLIKGARPFGLTWLWMSLLQLDSNKAVYGKLNLNKKATIKIHY
jgi:hypothetical protein